MPAAGNDDRVVGRNVDVPVVAVRHPHQGRARLALGAGADDGDVFGPEVVEFVRGHDQPLGHAHIAKVGGHSMHPAPWTAR